MHVTETPCSSTLRSKSPHEPKPDDSKEPTKSDAKDEDTFACDAAFLESFLGERMALNFAIQANDPGMDVRQKVARKCFDAPKQEMGLSHTGSTGHTVRRHSQPLSLLWILSHKKTCLINLPFMQSVVQFVLFDL